MQPNIGMRVSLRLQMTFYIVVVLLTHFDDGIWHLLANNACVRRLSFVTGSVDEYSMPMRFCKGIRRMF